WGKQPLVQISLKNIKTCSILENSGQRKSGMNKKPVASSQQPVARSRQLAALRPQPFNKCSHCLSPMRYGSFFFQSHFGEGFIKTGGNKNGVISETGCSFSLLY